MDSHHRGGLVGPVLLVGLGLIFLGQNLGWVREDIWLSLLRLWPLILVAAGIDLLIPRRSIWGRCFRWCSSAVFVEGSGSACLRGPEEQIGAVNIPLARRGLDHFSPPWRPAGSGVTGSPPPSKALPRGRLHRVRTESTVPARLPGRDHGRRDVHHPGLRSARRDLALRTYTGRLDLRSPWAGVGRGRSDGLDITPTSRWASGGGDSAGRRRFNG
jgi:hypothetical protein